MASLLYFSCEASIEL